MDVATHFGLLIATCGTLPIRESISLTHPFTEGRDLPQFITGGAQSQRGHAGALPYNAS